MTRAAARAASRVCYQLAYVAPFTFSVTDVTMTPCCKELSFSNIIQLVRAFIPSATLSGGFRIT